MSPPLTMNNGNGFKRDSVEQRAAYAVIGAFALFAAYTVYDGGQGLVDMLAVYIYGEMRAITVGRGEGGTFEGKQHVESKK